HPPAARRVRHRRRLSESPRTRGIDAPARRTRRTSRSPRTRAAASTPRRRARASFPCGSWDIGAATLRAKDARGAPSFLRLQPLGRLVELTDDVVLRVVGGHEVAHPGADL